MTTTMAVEGGKGKVRKGGAPAKPKAPERWKENLTCKLSRDEVVKKGDLAAALHAEIEQLEGDRKSAAASIKGRIDAKKAELRDAMRAIASGEEVRSIEVTEDRDYRTNTATVKRVDTGAILRTRGLRSDERQEELFGDKAKATLADAVEAKKGKPTNAEKKAARAKANGHAARKVDDGQTEITAPAALLEGAKAEEEPAKKRGRKPR